MRLGQHGEQARFRRPVSLIRAVKIQVFVGDIGQHADIKTATAHPMLLQTVRGRFEHHMGQPGSPHPRQIALHLGRFRRGHVEARVHHFFTNHRIDRRDHPRRQPRRQQDVVDQVRRGSFSVCARDSDHGHLVGRVVIKSRRQRRQRRP